MKLREKGISRRRFLWMLAGAAAAIGISGVAWEFLKPKEEESARQVRPNAYAQDGKSLVAVVKGNSTTDIETMVRDAVAAIGGIEKIVSTGKTVVIKPAVLTSDPDCAPDPRVVAAVAKIAREAGGIVTVAENSGGGDTAYCLSKIGITQAAEEVGAEVRSLPSENKVLLGIPEGAELKSVNTYPTIANCDVLVSVPRLKRHGAATVTISLKNMMGTVPQSEMRRFHSTALSRCIADLNTVIKPDLTVVDATFAMTRSGPTGGDMIEMNTIMVGGDPVAIDRVAAGRLNELEMENDKSSFDPAKVPHINAAADLGVGTNDLSKISIIERTIA